LTIKTKTISSLLKTASIGAILMVIGSLVKNTSDWHTALLWIGFIIILFGVISAGQTLFSDEEHVGTTSKYYYCPQCNKQISIDVIPGQTGVLFECPHCQKRIIS